MYSIKILLFLVLLLHVDSSIKIPYKTTISESMFNHNEKKKK